MLIKFLRGKSKDGRRSVKRIDSNIFEKEDAELAHLMRTKKKDHNKLEFVPMEEFVEFLNDIRDVLEKYQPTILNKISEFYAQVKLAD